MLVASQPTSTDSSAFNVDLSNEVTINGGVSNPYPPTIVRAAVRHGPLNYEVSAMGLGLAAVDSARLEPSDATWNAPLAIVAQTDASLTLSMQTSARLPATFLQVTGDGVRSGSEQLPAEQESPAAATAATAYYSDPQTTIPNRPKDFAFLYDGIGHFHLFYIKHNLVPPEDDVAELRNEKTLGHTWSEDLLHWAPADTQSFRVRPGFWDALHVWAPSIVVQGPTYYMFYTGVDASGNQRIGVAKTNNLAAGAISWTRPDSWVLEARSTTWADVFGTGFGNQQQFRDPFVMADPGHPGQYLMYYVAELAQPDPNAGTMVVGVARSVGGNLEQWVDIGPLRVTSFPYSFNGAAESPHVFSHVNGNQGQTWWWLFYSPNHLEFAATRNGPADVNPASWESGPTQLSFYLQHGANVPVMPTGYVGSEYLRALNREFFAAFTDQPGQIAIWDAYWVPQAVQDSVRLRNLQVSGVDDPKHDQRPKSLIVLSRSRPGEGYVGLRLDLPVRGLAHLDVLDLLGRRVKCLVNRELSGGVTDWIWNGSNEAGERVGSGIYFARLECSAGQRTVRVPFIR